MQEVTSLPSLALLIPEQSFWRQLGLLWPELLSNGTAVTRARVVVGKVIGAADAGPHGWNSATILFLVGRGLFLIRGWGAFSQFGMLLKALRVAVEKWRGTCLAV